jgi:predicted RNA-binding protein
MERGYPSDKAKADGIQKNPDGSPLPIEKIIDNLSVIMLRALTGKDAAGKQLSIKDWNISSMFATGREITSPCDTEDADSGPLSQECLSYLYMNQGNTSHIGSSYDSPAWLDASMKGQPERNTYCQPGTSLDPNTAEGLKLGQTLGGVEQAKNYYNMINRIANDDSRPNKEREKEIKQCFGVSLNPVVNNATPGPKQVFAVGPGYDYTRDQAAQVCAGYGAQVATKAQLAEAQTNGADWCFSAWVHDSSSGQWPITTSVIGGCGGRQGIIEWTPDNRKAGVNCYGPKPAINTVIQGTVKPFNGTSWDQPSEPGYTEVPSGYLQTSGNQPSCFSGLSPEQAKDGCNRLGDRCAGISYSKDGGGHGCYKGDQRGGLVNDPAYMGFVKTPLPPGNNQPYKTGNWQQIPGNLKQVSHDGNVVCGVNGYDDIYCKDNLSGGNWFQVPGKLKHVSVSNGKLYGANSNDDIFYNDNFRSANWRHIPGKLKQVDIDGNTVCGVNSGDAIYCKDNLEGGNWFQVPGGLKHVAVSNGKLYGTNSGDGIWYNNNFRSANWKNIPGGLKQVDIDGNKVCGVNSNDDIYCKDNLEGGDWFHVDGKLKYVSINNDKLYGVNSGNGIFAKI